MDLCDLAKSDAMRHIGSNEGDFERADAAQIAKRFGISEERVHQALDAGRGIRHVWTVGIPAWHELRADARAELEALDGVSPDPGDQAGVRRLAAAAREERARGERRRRARTRRADRRDRGRRARRRDVVAARRLSGEPDTP